MQTPVFLAERTCASLAPSCAARPRFSTVLAHLLQLPVHCTEDVLRVMALGARNRAVAETRMNERSSRSHSGGLGRVLKDS